MSADLIFPVQLLREIRMGDLIIVVGLPFLAGAVCGSFITALACGVLL